MSFLRSFAADLLRIAGIRKIVSANIFVTFSAYDATVWARRDTNIGIKKLVGCIWKLHISTISLFSGLHCSGYSFNGLILFLNWREKCSLRNVARWEAGSVEDNINT